MKTSDSLKEISPALIKIQSEINNVPTTSENSFFRSKYAPLDEILKYVRPILTKNGILIIQSSTSDEHKIGVTTRLIHSSGEWIEDTILIPLLNGVNKRINSAQEAGIIITYLRRYSITAMLGITGEDDNDGNGDVPPNDPPKKPEKTQDELFVETIEAITRVDSQEKCDKLVEWINRKFVDEKIKVKLIFELEEHMQSINIGV